jgi:hypothetical protein
MGGLPVTVQVLGMYVDAFPRDYCMPVCALEQKDVTDREIFLVLRISERILWRSVPD